MIAPIRDQGQDHPVARIRKQGHDTCRNSAPLDDFSAVDPEHAPGELLLVRQRFAHTDDNKNGKQRKGRGAVKHVMYAIIRSDVAPDCRTNGTTYGEGQPMHAQSFAPAVLRDDIGNIGRGGRRFETRGKSMNQPQKEKARYRAEDGIKKATNETYDRADRHHRYAAPTIG